MNSFVNSGVYLGSSVASLTTFIILEYGWRGAFKLAGAIGIFIGVLSLVLIKEPKRGTLDPPPKTEHSDLML